MGALYVDHGGAVAYGAAHPTWYIFPGFLEPDGVGGFLKRPLGRWTVDAVLGSDSEGIRNLWLRHVGDRGKAVVCVACEPSGIWVLDDDRELDESTGWPETLASLNTLTLRSCTKGRPHYVFRVGDDGMRPKEGRWDGGDVKSSGIIFIGDGDPILDVPPVEAPIELIDKLGATFRPGGAAKRAAASSEEMWDWITSFTEEDLLLSGNGPTAFLDRVLQNLRESVDQGNHRRQACRDAVWAAVKESASGFYLPADAYDEIRAVYQELREGGPGAKGWTRDRAYDYDLMWAGAIAAVLAGDLDVEIEENRQSVAGPDDEDIADLLLSWTAVADPSGGTPSTEEDTDAYTEETLTSLDTPTDSGVKVIATEGPGDTQEEPIPRAWAIPAPPPSPPRDPLKSWDPPPEVPPLASSPGRPPQLREGSALWESTHGRLARAMSEGSAEVSGIAILASSLTYGGVHLSGKGTHYIGADAHNPIVWSALVGRSAAARKSMSLSLMGGVFYGFPGESEADTDPRVWLPYLPRKVAGFNSGEVLIDSFLPPTLVRAKDEDEDEDEDTYHNPRAVAVESEMDRLWTVASRDGSVLGVILCNAWDGSELSVRSRGAGTVEVPSGAYALGLLGAATETRAVAAITRNEGQMAYSGLANRHLWFMLPDETADLPMADGELPWDAIREYRASLGLRSVPKADRPIWGPDIGMTAAAKELWIAVYPWLKRGSKSADSELAREMLSRAEPQVRRLALNFALARPSGPTAVDVCDLQNALEVWEYCRASVRYLLAPERTYDASSKNDSDVRRAVWALLQDPSHPGWATMSELAGSVRRDRGSLTFHVAKMLEEGVLVEGVARVGSKGKATRVVGSRKRYLGGKFGLRSEGEGSGVRIPIETVTWSA